MSEHEVERQGMIDDMGFGDMGIPKVNAIRGHSTAANNEFADEGVRLARMYTEPSGAPTR
jgi:arylsulfatase A-like enzyme